jgi:hypothetical protein
MWQLRRLTNLWASTACYRVSFTFIFSSYAERWMEDFSLKTSTLSWRMSTRRRHWENCSEDGCRRVVDNASLSFLWSYFRFCEHIFNLRRYLSLYAIPMHSWMFTCLLLASGRHNLNFLKNEYHIYINGCVVPLRAFKNPCRPGWRIFSQPAVRKGSTDETIWDAKLRWTDN